MHQKSPIGGPLQVLRSDSESESESFHLNMREFKLAVAKCQWGTLTAFDPRAAFPEYSSY